MPVIRTATADRHYCSHRHLTAEALVRSRASPCEIWGRRSGNGTAFFFPQFFISPLSVPFQHCSVLIFIHMPVLPEGQAGETWKPYKSMLFGNQSTAYKSTPYSQCGPRAVCIYSLFAPAPTAVTADRGHKTASSRQACGRPPGTVFLVFLFRQANALMVSVSHEPL